MEGHPKVHGLFLKALKVILPKGCCPIIITDAGFRNPWFKEVLKLGYDFIGRVRGIVTYTEIGEKGYKTCSYLHRYAIEKGKYLGAKILARKNPLQMYFYSVKEKNKGRKKLTKRGKISRQKDSMNYSRAAKEPWLLVTSLNDVSVAGVIKIYKRRMTIEESFRDMKSTQYGLSLKENKTLKPERMVVWLLINMLANFIAWITGKIAERLGLHYQFQANSIRHRRVLSWFYLGCQVIRKKLKIPIPTRSLMDFARECIL